MNKQKAENLNKTLVIRAINLKKGQNLLNQRWLSQD